MQIANHSYDESTQVYEVQFRAGGPVYQYQGVDADTANAVQTAEPDDLGRLIQARLVTGKPFEFVRVDPDQAEGDAA